MYTSLEGNQDVPE